jgi:hypothetical protein
VAVERDGDLAARVVLANVDQRVLLGELRECHAQALPLGGIGGNDDRLERRWRELVRERACGVKKLGSGWPLGMVIGLLRRRFGAGREILGGSLADLSG